MNRCGICKVAGHNAQRCPQRPGQIVRVEVPAEPAGIAYERCRGFLGPMEYQDDPLRSLMLSCYLQGAMDMLSLVEHHPQLYAEVRAATGAPEAPGLQGL